MTIRDAILADAAEIAKLTAELGYVASEQEIRARLGRITDRRTQVVLVALVDDAISGWLQAQASEVLESGFRVEIVGLVVAARARRQGVGRQLVAAAERWAMDIGAPAIVVRSNLKRTESHRFYPALGYLSTKSQAVYRKDLPRAPQ